MKRPTSWPALAIGAAAVAPAACLALGIAHHDWWMGAAGLVGAVGVAVTAAALARREAPRTHVDDLTHDPAASADAREREAEPLAALAAGLAHELGQPLSAARVGIEGLHYLRQLGREPSPEHVARTLAQVGMSLIAMTQTIEHLRALAAAERDVAPQAVDLAAVVDAVLAERDQWLRYRDVVIDWRRPEAPALALAEPAGLRLILVNLLRNAVEAVAGQGEGRRQVRVTISGGPSLAVHDSGPGIATEHLPRLFDPYFSTKVGIARGIGLSLAQASARRMGAEITATSTVGSGSTFTLGLRSPELSA